MHYTIRDGGVADAAEINRILNWYILNTYITFDLQPWSLARRQQWIETLLGPRVEVGNTPSDSSELSEPGADAAQAPRGYFLVVAAATDRPRLGGFAYNTPLQAKPGYVRSTETTIYCDPAALDAPRAEPKLGCALYTALFARLRHTHLHRAYAAIARPNPASEKFHIKHGYAHLGTLTQVGYKFGHYIDVAWYEKNLGE